MNLIKLNSEKLARQANYYGKKFDKLAIVKVHSIWSKSEHTFKIFCASLPCRPLEIA